jgi:hypothetical protein
VPQDTLFGPVEEKALAAALSRGAILFFAVVCGLSVTQAVASTLALAVVGFALTATVLLAIRLELSRGRLPIEKITM